jgi:hypothetical protein
MSPDLPNGELSSSQEVTTFLQRLPHTDKWRYHGKTVMLMDERTISQAEHSGLFLEAAKGTKFIGSPTQGANGDVTNLSAPGGIYVRFSGQGVWHPDGRQLQRLGLQPEIELRPTLVGIRAGKDEVLDRAIAYLQHGPVIRFRTLSDSGYVVGKQAVGDSGCPSLREVPRSILRNDFIPDRKHPRKLLCLILQLSAEAKAYNCGRTDDPQRWHKIRSLRNRIAVR